MRSSVVETRAGRETIRTLHVDDDGTFGQLTAELLESVDSRLEVVTATSASVGLSLLDEGGIDCVVSDYDMPGETGIEFLQRVREQHTRLPFILFTGKGSEEVAGEAVSAGVTDYLQKESGVDQYTVLANRIVNATEKYWTETDMERQLVQQEALATLGRDALEATDLGDLFDEAVESVADGLGCEYAKVLEWQPGRDELDLRAGVGWEAGLVRSASISARRDSQAGYTLASAEPVVVTDLRAETRFTGPDLLFDHDAVSGISVVIGPAEEPWGVLGTHTTSSRSFSSHDVTFVQNVANVLAAAIDRHEAQERLRKSESRFREIAELSPDGIFRTDVDGVFTYVSPASEAMLGRAADDLVGTPFARVVAEESHEAAREGLDRVGDGAVIRGLALTLVDADGEPFEVEVSASPVRHDGRVEFVQGFARDVTAKNERERELQQSRERFQALVDAFPNGGVFLFDEELRYTMAGGDELEKGGLTPEMMLGRTASEVFPPENAVPLEESYRAALDGEKTSFEDSYQGRHYHDQTIPLRNEDGDVIGGMSIAQNITERVERERELQESRERYQTLVDNFPGGVFLFDRDLRLSAAGGRELVQVGWDPEEIVGTRFEDVLPESAFEPLEPHYWAALEGESVSFELEQDGVYYDVQTIPLRDATGTVTAGMAVAQNVTERVERDRKIDQLRERSQALMYTETDTETAGVAVDAAQEVIDAPLSGYHRLSDDGDRLEPGVMAASVGEVFAETPVYDRGAEPGTRAALAWDVFDRGEPLYIDDVGAYEPLTEPSPSGSVLLYPIGTHGLFVVSSAEPNAYDETDRALVDILAGSLTAAMDRVEREQHLRGRERRLEAQNERLSQFASLVSHDLRNPLSVARGRAELARRTGDAEHFDAVARAHERMDRLIEELLQLTVESEDGSAFESLDLGDTATASWGSVDTGDASLVVETTRRVRADENRLRQVFENLFRNSVEHGSTTPRSQARGDSVEHGSTDSRPQAGDAVEHGSVDVEGADHAPLTVTVGGLPDGFYVEDTGPGIEPRRRETVFEAGHSSGSGTGLGLHIVRNVADEHGWTVVVTDGCQGGARFEFTDVEIEDGTGTDRE